MLPFCSRIKTVSPPVHPPSSSHCHGRGNGELAAGHPWCSLFWACHPPYAAPCRCLGSIAGRSCIVLYCIPVFNCGCINFLGKKWLKNLDDIAGRSTFAPAFGRGHEYMDSLEGDGRGDSRFSGVAQRGFGKNFEKSCRKIWKGRKKVFIFAPAFAPKNFAPKKGAGKQTKQE